MVGSRSRSHRRPYPSLPAKRDFPYAAGHPADPPGLRRTVSSRLGVEVLLARPGRRQPCGRRWTGAPDRGSTATDQRRRSGIGGDVNTIASGSTGAQRSASRPRGSASAARAASKLGKLDHRPRQRRACSDEAASSDPTPTRCIPTCAARSRPEPAQERPTPTGPHGGYGPRPPTRAPATPHRCRTDAATPHTNAAAPPPQHDRHRLGPRRSRWARPDQSHPPLDPRRRPPESPTSSSLLGVHDRRRMFVAEFETGGAPGTARSFRLAGRRRWRRWRRPPVAGTANDHNGHDSAPFIA
jgi:hypothetical protein